MHLRRKDICMDKTDVGTLLGKCIVDGQPIFEGSGFRSRHSTILNGKWISGDTILKVYPMCFQAFIDKEKEQDIEKGILMDKLEKYGWQSNPETGKLVKITGTKALNRTKTIGDK